MIFLVLVAIGPQNVEDCLPEFCVGFDLFGWILSFLFDSGALNTWLKIVDLEMI